MDKKVLTTEVGAPVADNQNSLTVGPRGPVLLQDLWLMEKMAHFDREVIPERRMHAKGSGAFGDFEVTEDISCYTKAKVLQKGEKTPVFVRFSTVAGERGAADAERDIRGFAIKFYTRDGNWDLVGNNTPVFFLRDGLKFPDLNHAVKRNPQTNLRSPQSFWDFLTLLPEAFQQLTIVMSDKGIPASYRNMDGFGSHTFSLIDVDAHRVWVKFHLKTNQGIKNLTDVQAEKIIATDRDSNQKDLFEAIACGDFPSWTMYFQIMTEEQAKDHYENPFDITKRWSQEEYPLIKVGKLTLNKNPDNYFAQVEQAAFSPAHVVPGIGLSPDKLLQSRLFSYGDAQRYRLGVNHMQIPVNGAKVPVTAFHRDGKLRADGNYGSTINYQPNSYCQWEQQPQYLDPPFYTDGAAWRYDPKDDPTDNCFYQAGDLWRNMGPEQKMRLINNTKSSISSVSTNVKYRHTVHCYLADWQYGFDMAKALNLNFEKIKQLSKLSNDELNRVTSCCEKSDQ